MSFRTEYRRRSHQSLALAEVLAQGHAVALAAEARVVAVRLERALAVAHCPSYQKIVVVLVAPLVDARVVVVLDHNHLEAD